MWGSFSMTHLDRIAARAGRPARRWTAVITVALAALISSSCLKSAGGVVGGPHTASGHPVLFVGNSLTYSNNLPGNVAAIAQQAGDTIDAWYVAYPDYALVDHFQSASTIRTIKSFKWEYVIMQQGPSSVAINRDTLVLGTQLLSQSIREMGATPALYMVWPDYTRGSFFDAVRISYQTASQAVNGVFMPAGAAWQIAWGRDPSLPFYGGDGFHPSVLGTYLASLVIFERITGRDARQLPAAAVMAGGAPINIPEATVRLLQEAAHEANTLYPAR